MPHRLTASRAVAPVAPRAPRQTSQPEAAASGWKPKTITADQRRMLNTTLDAAIDLPPGASRVARLAHARTVLGSIGSGAARVAAEHLLRRLPARSDEERARILSTATTLGAMTTGVRQALTQDAIAAGDARLALELVSDGATLTKAERTALAALLEGDAVLQNDDCTKNLARAALTVLAEQPAALRRFAQSLSTPSLLFSEVLANDDRSLMESLRPLVPLLSPDEARAHAQMHPRSPLASALKSRAAERA